MGISPDPPFDDSKPNIVMGYPSIDRYHHQAHQIYPPYQPHAQTYATSSFQDLEKYPNSNPYPQQYDDFYYQQQQQHYKPLVPEKDDKASFGSMMLILMIVLIACMGLMSLVMWFLFGTSIPQFEVTSFKISNFNATNTTFTGTWTGELSVKNTNHELAVDFDRVRSSVFYKEVSMGISSLDSFKLNKKQHSNIGFSMSSEQMENLSKFDGWVLPAIAKDRSGGVVVFSVRLAMKCDFISGNVASRKESLRVLCDNLHVKFTDSGEGTYVRGPKDKCLIRLHGDKVE
ncbi:hypothetical protein BUALT_Bualt09G0103500 [Buddleja alternifolia]|uniref:Late embryogenesis abundant protein LEA-2 subgroup domain-containing protein n=1 Tax=Buddleja alternifolia TaxID=168488 RepID=A0AAV6X9K2_9LAMI|nr:hypothetical protein BUALT_Bualt09G0103500 [Buddleja alternifolia]